MAQWQVADQVIIVTGASRGIGLATARVLSQRGAKVALLARSPAHLQTAVADLDPARTMSIAVDACDRAALERAFAQVVARWGRLDGLINNVGFQYARRIEIVPEEELRRLIDLNFLSAVFGCQCAIPHLRANGGGRIINISSASVRHENEFAHLGVYSACKAALDHLTAELRSEVKKDRIMVTLFSPGAVATGSVEQFDPQALTEAMEAWLEKGPQFDGAIMEAEVIGAAIAHCFEYPPGIAVEFMEVKPEMLTPKALESTWERP
jgi:NAD(P)-dependent dehydrogenase (short-subunit alcohol dehydrogenase family)